MKVSIMQPAYLPWLGYFDRIKRSDFHIVLDHVSMDRSSKTRFTNRNKIRTPQGSSWLTVPLRATQRSAKEPIKEIKINNEHNWQDKHLKSIKGSYIKTPYFDKYYSLLQPIYTSKWASLNPLLKESSKILFNAMDICTPCISSSELKPSQTKAELIIELCKSVDATEYISGPFGREYLDPERFINEKIKLSFHDYTHPEYKQTFEGFEPYMSVIDLLFNCGHEGRKLL